MSCSWEMGGHTAADMDDDGSLALDTLNSR